jgi:hypothetical protein
MARRFVVLASALVLIGVGVLAYGYWFAATHAAVSFWVADASDRGYPRQLLAVDLVLFSKEGQVLARAAGTRSDGGTVYLTSPAEYACHGVEAQAPFSVAARERWDRCFARQSRWLSTWIERASYVELRSGTCTIERLPIVVARYRNDWWLWWVPLVHVGGKPYTSYTISIMIDLPQCRAVA